MAVFWLKERLDTLDIKSSTLADRLKVRGIDRTRQAVDYWIEKESVPLLANPVDTKILAEALEWEVTDMLIAAGFDIQIAPIKIPAALLPIIHKFPSMNAEQLEVVIETVKFGMSIAQKLEEAELAQFHMRHNANVESKLD